MAKLCYNCGKPATTKDHIPPKCLFPKGTRGHLITVPSCRDCNESMALDDQYFAAFLAVHWNNSPAALRVWNETVRPQLRRADFQGLRKRFAASAKPIWLPSRGGFVQTGVLVGEDDRLDSSIRKIIKGLYHNHVLSPVRPSDEIHVYYPVEDPLLEVAKRANLVTVHEEVFQYRYAIAESEPVVSIWWLLFYRNILVVGATGPAEC